MVRLAGTSRSVPTRPAGYRFGRSDGVRSDGAPRDQQLLGGPSGHRRRGRPSGPRPASQRRIGAAVRLAPGGELSGRRRWTPGHGSSAAPCSSSPAVRRRRPQDRRLTTAAPAPQSASCRVAAIRTGSPHGVPAAASTSVRISSVDGTLRSGRGTRGGATPVAGETESSRHRTACVRKLVVKAKHLAAVAGAKSNPT